VKTLKAGNYSFLLVCYLTLTLCLVSAARAQVKVTTVAGGFINDNKPATSSALQSPLGGRMDSKGNLYIADQIDHRLRKVSTYPPES